MRRQLRMAALAASLVMALGTFALAQDRDDYYYRGDVAQTRQYGYDNGFRDGEKRGRHEGRENDPNDYHTPDWRQASHGYKNWMGPLNAFQNGYQQGYADGFRSGFNSERPGWRGDGDRDDRYRGNRYYGNDAYNGRVGYDTGYVLDHFQTIPPSQAPFFECWTTVAALLRETSRMRIRAAFGNSSTDFS